MTSYQPLEDLPASQGDGPPFFIAPAVLEAIPAAAYTCAANGTIMQFNARAAELWGRSPQPGDTDQRFCGSHRLYDLEGNHLPHELTPMATALRTGEPQHGKEVVIERPDGSRIIVLVHINALKDKEGRVIGAFNCFQDHTERKRSEEELRASQADLEDFFENSVVPMHWVNGNGIILRANRAELDLLGYDRSEYVGRHIVEFHADRAAIDDILQSLASGQLLNNFPARLKAKDGSLKETLISSSSRFRDGELVNTRCVTIDVTAETKAHEILRESERRTRELLEALPAAIYTTDVAGRITYFNQAAADLWGVRPTLGETRWCGSWKLYWPDGAPMSHDECPMAVALKEQRPIRNTEAVLERPDGARVSFVPFPTPLRNSSGELVGAVNMLVDITGRKRAEASLAQSLKEQRILYELTDRLHRAQSLDEVYDASFEAILSALGCQRASILLFDEADIMRFVAWRGLSDAYRKATDGHSPWTPDVKDPEPICVDDVKYADFPEELQATIEAEGIGALAFVPLVSGDRLLGKFMVYYDAPHAFTEGEIKLALSVGRQLGFAAARIRAREARDAAEEELCKSEARERARARELQTIMETTPAVIWIARDKDSRRIDGNPASYDFLRLSQKANASLSAPPDERPDNFRVFVDGKELAPEELPVQRAARGETIRNYLHETRFNDGTSRYLFGNASPLRGAHGEPSGAVSAFVDITDRIEAEKQRDLMIAELNHRVKNTLATVISIAGQSFSRDREVDDALAAFNARVRALAHTHTRLAEASWSGVSFKSLLLDELAPYRREDGGNARLDGPAVTLTPKCAVMLGMAVHELATNAAKYGALSVKDAAVNVSWKTASRDEDVLEIFWAERGGPQVRAPARCGFGRTLIERALAVDLGGEVALDFAAEGLRCSIVIPMNRNVTRVAETQSRAPGPDAANTQPGPVNR